MKLTFISPILMIFISAVSIGPIGTDIIGTIVCTAVELKAFLDFKIKFSKNYSKTDELTRRQIFCANLRTVNAHNSNESSYKLAMNEFSDLTNAEYVKQKTGYRVSNKTKRETRTDSNPGLVRETRQTLPTTVNWTTTGFVAPVKDQGQCGSCWAFSAVAAIEFYHAKNTGSLTLLSEQNLVDCTNSYGNDGCNGGWMDSSFKYVINNNGIDNSSYAYVSGNGQNQSCMFNTSIIGARITGYTDIQSGSEAALKSAVANIGVLSVAIDASHNSFQLYSSGIYYEPSCSSTNLDHAVIVVGYGTDNGIDYWLCKNQWGTGWGINGYIKMRRNRNNNCGIASAASYPTGVTN